jgi:hypothetical protein
MAEPFKTTQYAFSSYIRDPEHQAAPADVELRRMTIYRDLFFNNINGTLESAFPVMRTLFTDEAWSVLVRDFMCKHECKSPLFVDISREFLHYLEHTRQSTTDPAFLLELAHYEWVELALSIAEAEFNTTLLHRSENVFSCRYSLSPLAWLLSYQFPVHQISKDFQPDSPAAQPTFLLVYRNDEDTVKFNELNPVSARLLELLTQGVIAQQAVDEIIEVLQHPQPEAVSSGAVSLIEEWLSKGILHKQ